jgi:hypothetical protein
MLCRHPASLPSLFEGLAIIANSMGTLGSHGVMAEQGA